MGKSNKCRHIDGVKYRIIPAMSYRLYETAIKAIREVKAGNKVEIVIKEDKLTEVVIPETIKQWCEAEALTYNEAVQLIIADFMYRMTSGNRKYSKNVISLIKSYTELNEEKKDELIKFILKNLRSLYG